MEHTGKKICVAMSDGVDSSVAAHLLSAAGNRLIGVTMCLGVTDEAGRAACCGPQAVKDARTVCDQLGIALGAPCYVVAIDPQRNTVTLGSREELRAGSLTAREVNLFVDELPAECTAKIRYAQADVPCRATFTECRLSVAFEQPVEAVTPGQSVVLYDVDVVLGGGIIEDVNRMKMS